MAPRILTRGGLALVLAGAFVWLGWPETEVWRPVDLPLRLQHGELAISRFTTDRTGTYWIMLFVPRDMPFEELVRALGKSWGLGDLAEEQGNHEPILIPWEIRSDGAVVVSGPGRGNQGRCSSSAAEVGVSLGSFAAEGGREYSLSARVERTVEPLLGHKTRISVEADPMYFKNAFVGAYVRSACGFLAAVLGAFLLAMGLWLGRARRSAAAIPPGDRG